MSIQRVLAKLGPLLIFADRDRIPSFKSALSANARPRSWTEIAPEANLQPISAECFRGKRLIIFGEQHVQPQVLRAQLSILSLLHAQQNISVVMVLEHFNFLQDDLLRRFSEGVISNDALLEEYAQSKEGFQLNHYLPLLLLARELGVSIHGGFPPRQWASQVYKESIDALRTTEAKNIPDSFDTNRWSQVTTIEKEHVAYLNSMLSGGQPVLPKESPPEGYQSGILPAQTLKDTFFAWTIDKHLVDPNCVVYAISGLGHSEFDLCVSPRVLGCQSQEKCLVASKDWLSEEYIDDELLSSEQQKLADIVIPYEAQ